uniref:Uncharacterized protein n=1 Tax=Oryza sativa subsp. japonica TaxID=39947 RepID=Q75GA1_ORYSJ|nr:hypothetical protein [Oryza sativa Japonica Group]AAT73659.1 hypothetical protein [Oryza sativa Japonica Group]
MKVECVRVSLHSEHEDDEGILDSSDETNFFETSPTEKNFNSGVGEKRVRLSTTHCTQQVIPEEKGSPLSPAGNGQPPSRAAVNPEADQPDTSADPTPSRPLSPGGKLHYKPSRCPRWLVVSTISSSRASREPVLNRHGHD